MIRNFDSNYFMYICPLFEKQADEMRENEREKVKSKVVDRSSDGSHDGLVWLYHIIPYASE